MLEWILDLTMVWHAGLILALIVHATRTRELVQRIIAFDALSVVFVAALSVLALRRGEGYYLDIALIVAMLAFVHIVAATRLAERRRIE